MIGFLTGVVVSRTLGPAGRGEFSIVAGTVAIIVMLATMGINPALSQAKAKDGRSVAELYTASLVVAILVGAAAVVVVIAIYLAAGRAVIQVTQTSDLVWVIALIVPLLILNNWSVVAILDNRIKELGVATISGALFFLVAAVLAKLLGRLTPSSAITLWSGSAVLPVVLLLRKTRFPSAPRLAATALALVRFSLKANVVTMALILVWRVDVVLVDWQRGLRELGLYAVAFGLAEVLFQIAVSARIALTPHQGSFIGRDLLVARICRVNRLMLASLGIAAVVLGLGSTAVVRLAYGHAFAEAAPALVWLLPGVVALVLQGPPLDYLIIEGRLWAVTIVAVGALVVNVALNLALLPHHSFVVAALASTVAYTLSCGLILVLFARQAGVKFRPLMLVEPRDLSLILAMWRRRLAGAP